MTLRNHQPAQPSQPSFAASKVLKRCAVTFVRLEAPCGQIPPSGAIARSHSRSRGLCTIRLSIRRRPDCSRSTPGRSWPANGVETCSPSTSGAPITFALPGVLGGSPGAPEGFALRFVRNQLACKRNQTLRDPLRASGEPPRETLGGMGKLQRF